MYTVHKLGVSADIRTVGMNVVIHCTRTVGMSADTRTLGIYTDTRTVGMSFDTRTVDRYEY